MTKDISISVYEKGEPMLEDSYTLEEAIEALGEYRERLIEEACYRAEQATYDM